MCRDPGDRQPRKIAAECRESAFQRAQLRAQQGQGQRIRTCA